MKYLLNKFILKIIFVLFVLIQVNSAFSEDLLYILIDNSGSMWEKDKQTKNFIYKIAHEKACQIIRELPINNNGRKISIILFDSKKKSYTKQDMSENQARNYLKYIKPGDFAPTTIGDNLETVRKEIEISDFNSVEVHLFSDLNEQKPGQVPFDEAIKRFNRTMKSVKKKGVKGTLFAYTWTGITPKSIKEKMKTQEIKVIPINVKNLFPRLAPVEPFIIPIKGDLINVHGIKDTVIQISGFMPVLLVQEKFTMKIMAEIKDYPDLKVSLNNKSQFDITPFVDKKGKFVKDIILSIKGITPYLKNDTFLKKQHTIIFKPVLNTNIKQIKNHKIIYPDNQTTSFKFLKPPLFQINNYPDGTKIYKDNVMPESKIRIPLVMVWNTSTVGKTLEYKLPQKNNIICYLKDIDNKELSNYFKLDSSLQKTIFLNIETGTVNINDKINFNIMSENLNISLPVEIKMTKSEIIVKPNDQRIEIPQHFESDPIEIIEFIPNKLMSETLVKIKIIECNGKACNNLNLIMENPGSNDIDLQIGGLPAEVKIKDLSEILKYRVKAVEQGDIDLKIMVNTVKSILKYDKTTNNKLFYTAKFSVLKPELIWEIVNNNNKQLKMGNKQNNPIELYSRGEDIVLSNDILIEGFSINVKIKPYASNIENLYLKLQYTTEKNQEDKFIKDVLFNATKKSNCILSDFKNNSKINIIIDKSKKPLIFTNRDNGKIFFQLLNNNEDIISLPKIYYIIALRP